MKIKKLKLIHSILGQTNMNSLTPEKHDTIEIGGMLVSTIEFPGKISLVIFTAGCMLRCPYCHNPGIIDGGNQRKSKTYIVRLDDSLDFIDSVVLTGGEPLFKMMKLSKILRVL